MVRFFGDRLMYFAGRKLVRLYMEVGLSMDIVRQAPMPRGAKVIVANHPTTSDPFLITALSREHAIILIKEVLFKIPVFGVYLKWCRHIPVKPGEGHKAFEAAAGLLRRGKTIIVFMEGDISPAEGGMGKPKTGAVRLALTAKAPVVPVGIGVRKERVKRVYSVVKGTRELGTWYLSGPYAMTVGKALYITGEAEDRERVRRLSAQVLEKVAVLARESEKRIGYT